MVDHQAKQMNGRTTSNSVTNPVRGFVGQAAEVTGDVIELAELQFDLVKSDAVEALQIAIKPLMVIAVSGLLLLAAFPILLFAVAGVISRYAGLNSELAQLIVGVLAIVVSVLSIFIAIRFLRSSLAQFKRSSLEFKNNLTWLKTIFRSTRS